MATEDIEKVTSEYLALCHAMQSGVMQTMADDFQGMPAEVTPKHLRVGVNSALCSASAVAKILIDKGIITELEHAQAQRDMMKAEVEKYEALLSKKHGVQITLA